MNRIKWYGPSTVLILTIILVMVMGPGVVRQIAWAQSEAKINLIKEGLAKNAPLAEMSAAYRAVAEAVEPSVVSIQVSARQRTRAHHHSRMEDMLPPWLAPRLGPMTPPEEDQPDDQPQDKENYDKYDLPQAYGNGSGWVYDYQGHIITNNHVVEGADKIEIGFFDGSKRIATVVGTDPKTDVAVLKVEGGNFHPATMATEPVEQGDIVCAFGSPFHFDFSMSQGIVSAKGRNISILRNGYENYIRTDAAINPGNSGGPLCNIEGQVVAMNAAIASQTGAWNGLGFAIPIDLVKGISDQIIKTGKVVRGFLNIEIQELDPDLAKTYGYDGKGVLVVDAKEGGPANKAGIRKDDIITKVDGQVVTSSNELRFLVANLRPGKSVTVEFFRNGKSQNAEVTIGELPAEMASGSDGPQTAVPTPKPEEQDNQLLRKLGFESLVAFTPEIAAQIEWKFHPGVLIRSVRPASEAATKRLSEGDLIVEVMSTPVKTVGQLVEALKAANLTQGVRLRVIHQASGEIKEVPEGSGAALAGG